VAGFARRNIDSSHKEIGLFALVFILFTIIGTLTHELGHYLVGESLGLQCKIHYASCRCLSTEEKEITDCYEQLNQKYGSKEDIPEYHWKALSKLKNKVQLADRLWVTVGGPFQTITTGILGFIALLARKRSRHREPMTLHSFDWILVYLSLFWLRQPFNFIASILQKLITGKGSYFGGDELKISRHLDLWEGTISLTLAIIGLGVFLYVILKIIPRDKRQNFIIGGFIGASLGYLIWMKVLGPIMLP